MSGICGVWRKENPEAVASTLESIAAGLSLDGAGRTGTVVAPDAGVGVSARFDGQQVYEGSRVLVACDAELFNEDELWGMAGASPQAREAGTTAALMGALFERFGAGFVEKLRGAFSVILWDRQERQMLAAVDSFGMRRLVYYQDKNVFLVATRIDALVRSGEIEPRVNPRAVANILNFTANLAPETILTTVHRLPPASVLVARNGHTKVERYWEMSYGVDRRPDEDRLSRELESRVEASVALHCKEDSFDRVGAFLSGGTDSSTVAGMMSRMGRGTARAFSIGFQEERFNELEYARLAARSFKLHHHTLRVGPADCYEALPGMVRAFDEPFGNSSAIPTYFCARLAIQNGVRTLLAGDGGDELFGGNEWYRTEQIFDFYQRVPRPVRKLLIEPVLFRLPVENGIVGKARKYVRRSNIPSPERVLSYHFLCAHRPEEVLAPGFLEALGNYSVLETPSRYYAAAPATDHLNRLLYLDIKITLGDSDLPKVTTMCELAGIRPRFPFLDRSVVEFSGRIPAHWKVKGLEKRYLFKRAFRGLLPPEVIAKKKKGFGIPVADWLKTDPRLRELANDTLLSARALERGYFRRDFVTEIMRKHQADSSPYYGDTLWNMLTLELWHREFMDRTAWKTV